MKKDLTKKNDVKETMKIHSRAKVDFYGRYLERYLEILNLVDFIHKINIYDVFCGMGIYKDGHKGSPIVAFDIIKNIYEKSKKKKVHLVVNDSDIDRVNNVRKYIISHNSPTNCCDVSYYNKDAYEMLDIIKTSVAKSAADTRNLVFIDPYGYKEINKEIIDNLMENRKTEIILFLPISHMYRFTQYAVKNNERSQLKPLYEFIKNFFPTNHPIVKDAEITIMDYINYIQEALCFNGKYYSTSYHIERSKNSYFALFFISANLLGYEKILEAKWKLDTEDGNGFDLPKPLGLFDDQEKVANKIAMYEKLKKLLLEYLKEPHTNVDIYLFTLKNEFLPKHAVHVLKDLQNNGTISVESLLENKKYKKGAFYLSYKKYKETPCIIIRRIK